jgi:hypothetical protein
MLVKVVAVIGVPGVAVWGGMKSGSAAPSASAYAGTAQGQRRGGRNEEEDM